MYQPMNALNVYAIKNLHSALRACRVCTVRVHACVWVGRGHHIVSSASVCRADGAVITAAARQRGVTWVHWPPGSVTWTPSCTAMKSDCLIRGKQKCCQSSQTRHQQQQHRQPGRFFHQAVKQPSIYGILMTERRLAFTGRRLMVSKCPPVKMSLQLG